MVRSSIERGIFLHFCAVLALCGPTVSAYQPVNLRLNFESKGTAPAAIRDAAVLEAARVWEPYGIVVDAGEPTICTSGNMRLAVAIDLEGGSEQNDILGSVRFAPDGTPESKVTLHYRAIVKLATSVARMDLEPRQWPVALRDQIIARTFGRALAHEIGHILLRSPHH